MASVFEDYDFTPVEGNPFQPARPVTPTSPLSYGQPSYSPLQTDWIPTGSDVIPDDLLRSTPESWAGYAGNSQHSVGARIGAGMVEEARQYGLGMKNALEKFIGPIWGQGHVPQAGTGETGTEYAGAGLNLAATMGAPGGEGSLGAGWNPKALEYLKGTLAKKPALMPETAAAVQSAITHGPEWAQTALKDVPTAPGSGYANIALIKHGVEEDALKKAAEKAAATPPVKGAGATAADIYAAIKKGGPAPTTGPAGPTKPPVTLSPVGKAVSTPQTASEALGWGLTGKKATDEQLNKLFSGYVPPFQPPTMLPYDPTVTGKAALAYETAPGTSGKTTPFNPDGLPMDKDAVVGRMKDLGFAPHNGNWLFWRGAKQHGPYSWDSAAVGWKNPSTKDNEPGLFMAPDVSISGKSGKSIALGYGGLVNAHVIRSENPLTMDWKKAAGGINYNSATMQKLIKDAWAKGHDTLLLKNIKDISNQGNVVHDQMVVRNPNQLRHPSAAFNPKYKDLPNLLASGGLGFEMPPLVAQENEMGGEDEQSQ